MIKKILITLAFSVGLTTTAFTQNTNTSTAPGKPTRPTTPTTTTPKTKTPPVAPAATPSATATPAISATPAARARRAPAGRSASPASERATQAVRAAFDALIDGITRTDVNAVMDVYWNSPQLILFNHNGTVTRSWAQVRANRASSYPNLKDVKLAVSDVRVQMLGAEAALVTCLWTQTQIASGTPETATGRLTLVFRRTSNAWKIAHTHTSPDKPDPSRVLPSEQVEPPASTTTLTPQPIPPF